MLQIKLEKLKLFNDLTTTQILFNYFKPLSKTRLIVNWIASELLYANLPIKEF